MKKVNEWLNSEPKQEEIHYVNNDFSKPYLPIEVVKKLLNEYAELISEENSTTVKWHTNNFVYSYYGDYVNGSIELIAPDGSMRVGAASCNVSGLIASSIDNFVGTVKSMAITNAARDLGKRFGSDLYEIHKNKKEYQDGVEAVSIDKGDIEYNNFRNSLLISNKKLGKIMLETSEFKDVIEFQNIVNKLK